MNLRFSSYLMLGTCLYFLFSCSFVQPSKIIKTAFTVDKARKWKAVETNYAKWSRPDTHETKTYCRYFIYRKPTLNKCTLSHLIFDNNKYIGISNPKTFLKIDSVPAGIHTFSSKISTKSFVSFQLQPQSTYLIEARASDVILSGVLEIMSREDIEKALENKFFKAKFEEFGLRVEDFK